jgi:hypothetical protein
MIEYIKLKPDSFKTRFLRTEQGVRITTEDGQFIEIEKIIPPGWIPMRIYEYEKQLNDNKREIRLVERIQVDRILKEYRKLMQE